MPIDLSRIAVIGCPGSGKTVFSHYLGEITGRPVIHLDKELWQPNWTMPSYEQRQQVHASLINNDSWIIDGMWMSHIDDRLKRATTVIFLDYKRSVCFWRMLKRRFANAGKQRNDMADGCIDRLDSDFVQYIWNFRKKHRPELLQKLQQYPHLQIIALTSPSQSKKFLQLAQKVNLYHACEWICNK